jgi:hypothetical protein
VQAARASWGGGPGLTGRGLAPFVENEGGRASPNARRVLATHWRPPPSPETCTPTRPSSCRLLVKPLALCAVTRPLVPMHACAGVLGRRKNVVRPLSPTERVWARPVLLVSFGRALLGQIWAYGGLLCGCQPSRRAFRRHRPTATPSPRQNVRRGLSRERFSYAGRRAAAPVAMRLSTPVVVDCRRPSFGSRGFASRRSPVRSRYAP